MSDIQHDYETSYTSYFLNNAFTACMYMLRELHFLLIANALQITQFPWMSCIQIMVVKQGNTAT